jgi:DNA-binding SARP family transcriptional activator
MGDSRNSHLLPHILLKLSPDVFFHPLWMYYFPRSSNVSNDIIEKLQLPIQKLLKEGDYRNAAQMMLVCAALQKRYGEPLSAIGTAQKVWSIGLSKKMPEIASWAAWGGCAIWVELGQFLLAAEYLERLQRQFGTGEDWVLASTLEIVKNTLRENNKEQGSLAEIISWMWNWGEPSYDLVLQVNSNGHSKPVSPYGHSNQALPRFSIPWWKAFIKMTLQFVTGAQALTRESQTPAEMGISPVIQPPATPNQPGASNQLLEPSLPLSEEKPAAQGAVDSPVLEEVLDRSPGAGNQQRLSLKFYCLGNFRLYQNDQWVYRWASRKALSVLKYLVVYHPNPVSKDALMDSLWPDADPESARRNLHQAIYTLRHTLKAGSPEFQHVLFEKEHYLLNPQMDIWLDFIEFEWHYQEGQQMEKEQRYYEAIRAYETAEHLYRGDFMGDDLYEDLPVARRQYFWEMYLSTVYRMTRCYLQLGQTRAAVVANQKVLERDKTQEPAHQNLMQCYIQQGQRNLAIRQYQNCVQILKEELNIPPSAETRALYEEMIKM